MKGFTHSLVALGFVSLAMLPLSAQSGATTPQSSQPKSTQPKTGDTKSSQTSKKSSDAAGKLAAADSKFVHEAAIGGMAEVEMGKLAADKASSADVKQFGQRMVDDHGKANDELKTFASQKGETIPTDLDATHKSTQARLSKLTGEAFDKAYMAEMVKDHDKDVAEFKHASTASADADLKAWAGKTLPTLEEHQKMAHDINAKLGGGAAKSKKSSGDAKTSGSF